MATSEAEFERRMRERGLLPRASLGGTRLKRIPDNDEDPGNDRFSAYVIDADGGVGREAELTRGEASGLQSLSPDAKVLGDDEPLVGPEQEEMLAQAARPKPAGPSAREVALRALAEGRPGMGPETIASMYQDERALAGRAFVERPAPMDPELAERIARERARDARGGGDDLAQRIARERARDAAGGSRSAPTPRNREPVPGTGGNQRNRPIISVGKPGAAGALRPVDPMRAPTQQAPAPEALATREAPVPVGDEEFAAAQERAQSNRLGASLGRAGETIAAGISGRKADGSFYDGLEQDADLPVTELLARREADRRKALQDPTSEPSRRLQQAVAKALPGVYSPEELAQLTAEDERMVTQYGAMKARLDERKMDIQRATEQRQEDIAREDARRLDDRKWQAGQAAAGRAFTASENAKNRAADIAEAQARSTASASAAQKLPAGEASALGEAEAAVQSLKDLGAAYDKDIASGFGSPLTGLTQYLPGTDATLYEDKMRATAQSVGTFLEGGKLAAGDEVKYLRMLPTPGDGAERKKGKIDNLNRLIATKRQEKINALKAAGFNLGSLGADAAPAGGAAKTVVDRIKMPDGKTVTLYSDGSEEVS